MRSHTSAVAIILLLVFSQNAFSRDRSEIQTFEGEITIYADAGW